MKWIAPVLALLAWHAGAAQGTTLVIENGGSRIEYSPSQLLARPDLETITVADSVYHRRVTRFRAISVANLFKGVAVPPDAMIQCTGSDGFSAVLQRARLLDTNPKASHAYLAIEDPQHPWPVLEGESASAGPFYVVWTNPRASAIGREEWPFKLASLTVISDPASLFPHSRPGPDAGAAVTAGFKSFQKNCLACHRMNGDGAGSVGPDLNRPSNPTDYLRPEALRKLIRDPGSLRTWSGMVMRGFSSAAISDGELTDLLAYLAYMSRRKLPP